MKSGIKHQQKYLNQICGDADYDTKLDMLKQELEEVKGQYKKALKDHKVKEGPLKESHERMVGLETEHKNLKRKLIAIKNGIDVTTAPHPSEDLAKAIAQS